MSDTQFQPGPAMQVLHEHVATQAAAEIERRERESRRTELLREAERKLRSDALTLRGRFTALAEGSDDLAARIRKELGDA